MAVSTGYDDQVRVCGFDVRIRVQGDRDGDPLLLLNGLARPLESWQPFVETLRNRMVVTFDSPGVGLSPTPIMPLPMPMLATIAAGVQAAVGLTSSDVLGFSHGGAVAQQLAIQRPDSVQRLVLAATSCGVGAIPGSGAVPTAAGWAARDWPPANALGAFWHYLAIATWSSIPFLGAIRMPTLVVCGERDNLIPPANSRLLARGIPTARLVVLPAGHDLQRRTAARALVGAVESFLSTPPIPASVS